MRDRVYPKSEDFERVRRESREHGEGLAYDRRGDIL